MTAGFFVTLDRNLASSAIPSGMNVMLPMASWWRVHIGVLKPTPAPRLPANVGAIAVDTGSYALGQHFSDGYPIGMTPENIAGWASRVQPGIEWAALPDWPCEGKSAREVREIQWRGTNTALHMLECFSQLPFAWCPVLQGQTAEDYIRHVTDMAPTIAALADFYRERGQAGAFRVCIGSICRRNEVAAIRSIVEQVAAVLPGQQLHLFGVKLAVFNGWLAMPSEVYSLDSAAANGRFGSDLPCINADQRARGMTQAAYTLQIRVAKYSDNIRRAMERNRRDRSCHLAASRKA